MEECVQTLQTERETELDLLLIHQAKCSVVANQRSTRSTPSAGWGKDYEESKLPAAYVVKAPH